MERKEKLEIVIVSGACCNRSLVRVEQELQQRILEAVERVGLNAELRIVSLSSVLAGKESVTEGQSGMINALFQKYGARFAPAALVDQRVLFAGRAPTLDELTQMLHALLRTD